MAMMAAAGTVRSFTTAGGSAPPPNVPPSVTISSPANNSTFTAPADITIAASAFDSDGRIGRVDFYAGASLIGSDTTGANQVRWTGVPAGTYTLTARATDDDGATTTSGPVSVTVNAAPPPAPSLPSPWTSQDIGAVGTAGSASASDGTFTVRGAGADIWGTADAFRFAWQRVSGDVDIVARVVSIENVHAWVKAGVMIREHLTAHSAHGLMLVSPGKGLAFQRRVAAGGVTTHTGAAGAPPSWVKLERRGGTIRALTSSNGTDWTLLASDSFSIGPDVHVGLAVSSHDPSRTAAAVFDNVRVTAVTAPPPPPPPPPSLPTPWQAQDIGAVGPAGSSTASAGTFTVRGAGADIWGSADAFHYAFQPMSGDVDVIARVASVENVHAWVKAGVMIREQLSAGAPHALMLVSPGKGLAFQRRIASGGLSTHTSGGAGTAPAWVKLERRANTITAFVSSDGGSWTLVGSDTFTMAASVYVGLAVSSHDTTRTATATFDQVTVRAAGTPPPPPPSAAEIVLYASDVTQGAGAWTLQADATAAGGRRVWLPDAGRLKVTTAAEAPADFIEFTFNAEAGRAYRLWIRGRAQNDDWSNDSVHVQFSGSVNAENAAVYRIGTTSSAEYNLESCKGCGLSGWGWEDNGWGVDVLGPLIYFATTGPQTIRIQNREDGLSIDQIVLSSSRYLTAAPGATKNDTTIVSR
jgi:regulation of enolase protein 1 (concanavalin A-like superfamily)